MIKTYAPTADSEGRVYSAMQDHVLHPGMPTREGWEPNARDREHGRMDNNNGGGVKSRP